MLCFTQCLPRNLKYTVRRMVDLLSTMHAQEGRKFRICKNGSIHLLDYRFDFGGTADLFDQ